MKLFCFHAGIPSQSLHRSSARSFKASFTLMELLLVIVIVGIAAGVAMPSMVESIRWRRLHTASRTVVTVARYARSMAILKQSDLSLSFNLDTGQVDMIASNTTLPRFTRVIKGVTLESVEIAGNPLFQEGVCTVPYRRNGTCRPFSVKIRDIHGNYIRIKVDALSSVKTRQSGKQ